MDFKKILILILFSNFVFAAEEVEEKIKFKLNFGIEKCPINNPKVCDSFIELDSREMTLKGDPLWLRGTYEFSKTVLGVSFSASINGEKVNDNYNFSIWIVYSVGDKTLETKFFVISPTPRDINYIQIFGQEFKDSEFNYRPSFIFNG